ncbi:type II asparaginase [Flavobacterium maritimum]|jgi:L-asparaginase|uniref:type II asparaginase n=1 Tax=Flavobacterium maritimum TaxID=3149042 RepID=UPI0032B37803
MKKIAFLLFLSVLSLQIQAQDKKADSKKLPNVVILATGGTIAGAGTSSTGSAYTSGQVKIEAMIDAVPNIRTLANLRGEQIANVGSQDMSVKVWLDLANRINELLKGTDVDGIVITHGTDTQEETAFFLNLVVKSDKPVVLTGSMRPSTALSADGPLNMYNAVAIAANPKARGYGVMVLMNDDIHSAHDVKKMITTPVQTFQSPLEGLLGTCIFGEVEFFHKPFGRHTTNSEFSIDGVKELPRVDIVYACADSSPDLIDIMVKAGAKGIVIAGVGDGNMNAGTLEAAKRATANKVPVVRASRVPIGAVLIKGEVVDADYGTVSSAELNPQKARILLMLALLKDRSREDLQRLYIEY